MRVRAAGPCRNFRGIETGLPSGRVMQAAPLPRGAETFYDQDRRTCSPDPVVTADSGPVRSRLGGETDEDANGSKREIQAQGAGAV